MSVRRCSDRDALRRFLNKDALEAAYALGDLDAPWWEKSEFWGAFEDGELHGVVLFFRGLSLPSLSMHGDTFSAAEIMREISLDREVFYLAPASFQYVISQFYDVSHMHSLYRMSLSPDQFATTNLPQHAGILRMQASDSARINKLYARAADPGEEIVAFSPEQIDMGFFYGIEEDGELLAAAGTHAASVNENIAAIGNVFTAPGQRGKGLATLVTGTVAQALLEAGINRIVLNVKQDNIRAIRIYQRLGFNIYCNFIEGPGNKLG